MDLQYYVAMREERDLLAERVRQLEAVLFDRLWHPSEWGLTQAEATVVNILVLRRLATKDAILTALYGADPNGGANEKIVDVIVCKLRPKLRRHGVKIETVWGQGFKLDDAGRFFMAELWKAAA